MILSDSLFIFRTHVLGCTGLRIRLKRSSTDLIIANSGRNKYPPEGPRMDSLDLGTRSPSSSIKDGDKNRERFTDKPTMFIIVRRDLDWPIGSLVAQACHCAVSCAHKFYHTDRMKEYLSMGGDMCKVILEVKKGAQLEKAMRLFSEANIEHERWIEQPEEIITCVSTAPYKRSEVDRILKRIDVKLFK